MKREVDQEFIFNEQDFILTPEKAMYWKQENALLLADLHLGKAGHFRRAGIPVPATVNSENLERLDSLISHFKPKKIYFLGDLFHSHRNKEWDYFKKWMEGKPDIDMCLTLGNHEFYEPYEYEELGLECFEALEIHNFILVHDLPKNKDKSSIYITGHIHPSVRFKGKGRQSLKCACFHFSSNNVLLPAFGGFTGTHNIKPTKNDYVFPILDRRVLNLNQ